MTAFETKAWSARGTASFFRPPEVETYPLRIFDNYLIADLTGRRVLLDTGTPVSIGRAPLSLLGSAHNFQTSFMALSIDTITKHIGCALDCLIGTDVFRYFNPVTFCLPE